MNKLLQKVSTGSLTAAFTTALFMTTAFAAPAPSFKVKPFVYDPGNTGIIISRWEAHTGLPDSGTSDHGLHLVKNGATPTNAAAGATVEGVEGMLVADLTSFGFDYKSDGHCGAGAPRFNIVTTDGVTHFFGCAYGVHTPVPDHPDWTRVRFSFADGFPPLLHTETIASIFIIFDEGTDTPVGGGVVDPGHVFLDNININDVLVGKPGTAI